MADSRSAVWPLVRRRPVVDDAAGELVPTSTAFVDRWSTFVDRGCHDLFWSGIALVWLLLRILVLVVLSPFAWLGVGARQAIAELRHPATTPEDQ